MKKINKKTTRPYWQPELTNQEWTTGDLFSFQVFRTKKNAVLGYPNRKINRYTGNDIEGRVFVD